MRTTLRGTFGVIVNLVYLGVLSMALGLALCFRRVFLLTQRS